MWKEFLQDIWQHVQMNNSEDYKEYLSFCLTISTTILSIGVSIFTLTTAFIVNKKEAILELHREVEKGGISLSLSRRIQVSQNFIRKMKQVTRFALYAIAVSLILLVSICFFRALQPTNIAYLLSIIMIVGAIFLTISLISLFRWYLKK